MFTDARYTAYGATRYTNEVHRLYGVLDKRLQGREFIAGAYSIADMACWPWIVPHTRQGIDLGEFPALQAWFDRVGAREAVRRGQAVGEDIRRTAIDSNSKQAEKERQVLFNQRARG
jgi:glutathione S-transferase/GST-like protein